jgi:ankyrin repeat protein
MSKKNFGFSRGNKNSGVNQAELAYNAWGDEKLQRKVEQQIETAIYNGANANVTDDRHLSALHWAAEYDWPSLVTLLVQAHRFPPNPQTDINLRAGKSGQTALMLAVNRGHHECVEVLLQHGADLKLEHDGMSAVDMAIEEEDEEIYVLLCKFDPDLAEFNDDTLEMHDDMMAEIDELEHEYGGLDEAHHFDDDSGVEAAAIRATKAADMESGDAAPKRRRKRGKLKKRGAL